MNSIKKGYVLGEPTIQKLISFLDFYLEFYIDARAIESPAEANEIAIARSLKRELEQTPTTEFHQQVFAIYTKDYHGPDRRQQTLCRKGRRIGDT